MVILYVMFGIVGFEILCFCGCDIDSIVYIDIDYVGLYLVMLVFVIIDGFIGFGVIKMLIVF